MEVWYYWLALAVATYVFGRDRFKGDDPLSDGLRFAVDVLSLLFLLSGLVVMVNDTNLPSGATGVANIWIVVLTGFLIIYVAVYAFRKMLPDIFEKFVEQLRWR